MPLSRVVSYYGVLMLLCSMIFAGWMPPSQEMMEASAVSAHTPPLPGTARFADEARQAYAAHQGKLGLHKTTLRS